MNLQYQPPIVLSLDPESSLSGPGDVALYKMPETSAGPEHSDEVIRRNSKGLTAQEIFQKQIKNQNRKPPKFKFSDFSVFLSVNLVAALFAPILDCDEVFNYWEPLHYLNRGFGLQTWEYSPEFAIRSWFYIILHAVPAHIASLVVVDGSSIFYIVRSALAVACAYCQTRLFSVIVEEYGYRAARIFQLAMLSSTGFFYASVAFLPSSFAMLTNMLGIAAFLDFSRGLQTSRGIFWFGTGAVIGWPFSAALVGPLLFDELASLPIDGLLVSRQRVLDGVSWVFGAMALDTAVNTFFYRKFAIVPWRIVAYNVFGGSSRGPNIFGTEPWHFYIRNLLLNFNIWFILAILAGPVLVMHLIFGDRPPTRMSPFRSWIFTVPFYLWFAIFSLQPHKEERFMYPAYPFLCLNAAVTVHYALFHVGSLDLSPALGHAAARVKFYTVVGCAIIIVGTGVLRTLGTVTAYRAPLEVYAALGQAATSETQVNVCIGKEWYRFSSSYFLAGNMRAKFVKSAFNGLLPGEFVGTEGALTVRPTWIVPEGMNNLNQEDPNKLINLDQCTFMIDSSTSDTKATHLEPDFIALAEKNETWEFVTCRPFLDAAATHILARIFWVPDWPVIPRRYQRKWGRYCLLKRTAIV